MCTVNILDNRVGKSDKLAVHKPWHTTLELSHSTGRVATVFMWPVSWELTVHPSRHILIWQQPYVSVYVGQWPSWAWQLRKDYRLLLTGTWTVSKGHQESQFLQPVKYCSNSTRVITEVSFCSSLLILKGISDKKRWDCYYCLSSISWKIYEIKRESKSQINKKKHRKKQNDHLHKVLNKYIIEIVKKNTV